ncbi:MAG: EAL domain-containing protein [Sphingomicrobium sp.]
MNSNQRLGTRERRRPVAARPDRALEAALAAGMVDVLFQPWIELKTGRIVGAEALARSSIEPDPAILFERAGRAGLAERLSRLVQSTALEQAARWSGPLADLGISLNLLPSEVAQDGHDDWLIEEMRRLGFDPGRLTIEITEHALIVSGPAVLERLERLRSAGVTVALDDFGSGYASLDYLANLPIDLIKIDRALVTGLVGGRRDRIVMKAMIRLAQELEIKTLVEGVEDAAQLALLHQWDCDLFQGFLGSAALDQTSLARFVASAQSQAA